MENILNTNEEQNLVKLFQLKNIAYHETLKEYIFILHRVKNVKFDKKIEYKDIDLTTVLIDKNIDCNILQKNIIATYDFLYDLNEELKSKLDELYEISVFYDDYVMFNKSEKSLFNNCYLIARYIEVLCTTDIYKTFIANDMKIFRKIDKELTTNLFLSLKKYFTSYK
ncbi:hypothetical protein [Aliarcobacter cryaerophilus]|uniref:hypothetical protein n=1 Tax=Aliarcobacter cryaerophilus TaxID=28198 RepID=UPI0021B1ACEB|nr:hypothetical protein [Aliarcobacter cryaerophilus]MCT7464924.1 hypothetical protein [Aliarcobacter cryaerophilus]